MSAYIMDRYGDEVFTESINTKTYKPLYMILLSEKDYIAKAIRKVTKSDWSHCALSLDAGMNKIYSFNVAHSKGSAFKLKRLGGFSRESLFDPGNGEYRTRIYAVYVPSKAYDRVQKHIDKMIDAEEETKYDYVSIIKRIFSSDIKEGEYNDKMVCSSFVNYVMKLAGRPMSEKNLPSPQDMDDKAGVKANECFKVYDGLVRDYDAEKTLELLKRNSKDKSAKPFVEWDDLFGTSDDDDPSSGFNRFHRPSFIQEGEDQLSEDKELTVGDLDLDDKEDDNGDKDEGPNEDVPGYLEGRMSKDDLNKFKETENMDPNDVQLGTFGSDTSDVQNDYDPKDVETLMKLMASEADALGEYLEAAKETNTDVLRRLYADIGDEERFHMEQLLFAKSELTGEKYEPKDPDVKKEYEELLAMGMDEETAMQTAVDKCHIRVAIDRDDDKGFEDSVKDLEDNVKELQETFELINVTTNIILEAYEHNERTSPYVTPIMECAFYQEAFGAADSKWDPATSINPFKLLGTLMGKAINLILNLVSKFRRMFNQTRNRLNNARAFVKEHGYGAIFQQGIHLYFEPVIAGGELGGRARINPLIWKWYLCTAKLHNRSIEVLAKEVPGLRLKNYDTSRAEASSPDIAAFSGDANVVTCSKDVPRGIQILDKLDLIRTKMPVPVDETQRQTMFEYLTGYKGDDKDTSGKSDNFINQLSMNADIWKHMMVTINENINVIADQRGTAGSNYNKNASRNDISYRGLKACVDTCQKFSKCIMSDIKEIAAVCNAVYSNMVQQDRGDIENNVRGAGKQNAAWEKKYAGTRVAADQINTKKTGSMK